MRIYTLETLADNDTVLIFNKTKLLKQSKTSCNVAQQYTNSTNKITNYQINVFTCYISLHNHTFINQTLYLPKRYTDYPTRIKASKTKPVAGTAESVAQDLTPSKWKHLSTSDSAKKPQLYN